MRKPGEVDCHQRPRQTKLHKQKQICYRCFAEDHCRYLRNVKISLLLSSRLYLPPPSSFLQIYAGRSPNRLSWNAQVSGSYADPALHSVPHFLHSKDINLFGRVSRSSLPHRTVILLFVGCLPPFFNRFRYAGFNLLFREKSYRSIIPASSSSVVTSAYSSSSFCFRICRFSLTACCTFYILGTNLSIQVVLNPPIPHRFELHRSR